LLLHDWLVILLPAAMDNSLFRQKEKKNDDLITSTHTPDIENRLHFLSTAAPTGSLFFVLSLWMH